MIVSTVRNNERKNAWCPITNNRPGFPPPRVVAGQVRVSLDEGDLVILDSTVETRANMDYATLSADFLRYTLDGQYIVPDNPLSDAGIVARPMGSNIWDEPHYRVSPRHAHFQAQQSGVYVFQHVIYGMSSAYTGDPTDGLDIIYVEQYATVFRQ